MPESVILANATKKETVGLQHIAAHTVLEIETYPPAAAIFVQYMADNRGDLISIVGDHDQKSPFKRISLEDIWAWTDVTDRMVNRLMEKGVLVDKGKTLYFDDEPEVWTRKLELTF